MFKNICDLAAYHDSMAKSMTDKAWFLNEIDWNEYRGKKLIFVDIGCADGTMGRYLMTHFMSPNSFHGVYNVDTDVYYYGFDLPEIISDKTEEFGGRIHFAPMSKLMDCLVKDIEQEQIHFIVIMSSVLHEICSNPIDRGELIDLRQLIKSEYCDYLAIRDMCYNGPDHAVPIRTLISMYKNCDNDVYKCEFTGALKETDRFQYKPLAKFLLTYQYTENFDTEMSEDYFSNWHDYITEILPDANSYTVLYCKNYLLPYYVQKWREDWGLTSFEFTTHERLLYKLRNK